MSEPRCILLVEPDPLLARVYIRALELGGYDVSHASTAQRAIDVADERVLDLIILELQLPGHSGVEFLHELRSYAEWQSIPVIANTYIPTATLAAAQQTLAHDLGVVATLYKPRTSLQQLLAAVGANLRERV